MKQLREISSLRWQVLILFLAAIIAIGYMAYFVFKFYKAATSFIDRHRDDDDDGNDDGDDDGQVVEEKVIPDTENVNTNGQPRQAEPAI